MTQELIWTEIAKGARRTEIDGIMVVLTEDAHVIPGHSWKENPPRRRLYHVTLWDKKMNSVPSGHFRTSYGAVKFAEDFIRWHSDHGVITVDDPYQISRELSALMIGQGI